MTAPLRFPLHRLLGGSLLVLCCACGAEAPAPASALRAQLHAARDTCESTHGVLGFAHLLYDASTVIRFYAGPDSAAAPVTTVNFHPTEHDVSFRIDGQPRAALRPELHKLDYGLFELHVLARRDGWLRVGVGGGEALWMPEDARVRFDDWLASMQQSYSTESRDWARNPLRAAASDDAAVVAPAPAPPEDPTPFSVLAMEGDWILLEQGDPLDVLTAPPAKGWVRWRDAGGCLAVWVHRLS